MINNYGDTGSGFGGHGQPSAPLPRSMDHSKQQNVAPGWGYNTQLEGLYSCYPSEPQPMYNIHSMGHFESSGKHNNNHYPQYPAGAMHQPVPTPVVKCHEACCQNLSDHSRYPVNPAPLRYPPTVSVQPPRYGDITNSEHRQYFQDRRALQSSVNRKKEFQADAGFTGVHHDRHFSQCVGRGQIHVPESRQSMQVVRSQYPMYPINSYWSPRSWTGPRVNYPPPPPYHQSVSSQSAQLQSGIKMPDQPHYMEPNMQKQLGNQQRRTTIRNGNGTSEVVRPVPENKRPPLDGNHIQSCYDFPYTSGFVPFNDVSKITSNGISQITNTSCKMSNDKQFQHQMQYAVQSNDRTVSGCNDPMGDIGYTMNFSIPSGESYMRQPVEGSEQLSATRKLAVQYEQPSVGKKRPDLDVRQFLATWEDDEEDNARMSEPLANNNNGPPYIVVDYRSLDNESSVKTQERLKPSGVQVCSSKPQNSSPGLDNKRQTSEDVNSREKEKQRSVIHGEYLSQNSFLQPTAPSIHNDVEKNINFWGSNTRDNCPVSETLMNKSVFQPLDCSKRDSLSVVEPIMPPKRDSHMHGDMSNHKMISSDSNHISFDALVTYYGDSRRGSDGSYDLVEMTERLVNATDKICTSERSPLEQQLQSDIMGCNEMRVHHQPQIGVNPNSFHNRMPPHYATNTFQHYKQSVSTDNFFNLKQPVAHNKYFSIDQSQMMDQGNFEFHKNPAEFENQRTYNIKDNTSAKTQDGMISKDGRKACQQDNKKPLYSDNARNSEVESSSRSRDKENVEFVSVDPEQFITPIIIKKSDYHTKNCDKSEDTIKDKNSQTEAEIISEKTLFNPGSSDRTVLISSSTEMATEVFKVPFSPDKKQFSQKDNVVTLHSGDNTKCNTVTVEVPYVQQYSNLVKLSEEMTQTDNISDNKNCTSSDVQYNTINNCNGPCMDVKNKADESKRTTSLKLKRLPNSKEWIKIDEEMKLAQKNDSESEKNENRNVKDSTPDNAETSSTRVINLNMPSLDDTENNGHIENVTEAQRIAPVECRGASSYSSRSRHNDNNNSDNMPIPQLAIVSPLKFVTDNKDESPSTQNNVKQKKDIYFQSDKQFFNNNTNSQNYEVAPPTNSCLQHEIETQFQQVHSPYNSLYLSQKQNLVQSGHSSATKHFSDIQFPLSENSNEKHESFKLPKKIQRVESFQQAPSTDLSENNQQILKSKDSNKEQFSSFYSEQDITSHMSPFNLSNRLLSNEKDLDHHIPTSPGVDEMFEDINNPDHDSLFQNKTDNLPELSENSSFTLTSSCQTANTFDSFFESGSSSIEGSRQCENVKKTQEEITLNQSKPPDDANRPNCCIIKNNTDKSVSCENIPSENGEPLSLTVKGNSTWNVTQNRETCQEKNVCDGFVPAEESTAFPTLNSSEQISPCRKHFINESFHSFEYVHTSVLHELNDAVTETSSELIEHTTKHDGKYTNLENDTKFQVDSKSDTSLTQSSSSIDSDFSLKVTRNQNHTSDKDLENSDLKEVKGTSSNEIDKTKIDVNSTTKLESLDKILSTKNDDNSAANEADEHLKISHGCKYSPVSSTENIKQEKEIIQSIVTSVVKTSIHSEVINLCGEFNTTGDKDTVNSMDDADNLKQVSSTESDELDKSQNESWKLHVGLCSANENTVDSENAESSLNSVTDNETNLTDSLHSNCEKNSPIIAEISGNCIPIENDAPSLHLPNQAIENEENNVQEMLKLTENKFAEPCKENVNETKCGLKVDSGLITHEINNRGNENQTEENQCTERHEVKPSSDVRCEQTADKCENIPLYIDQEDVNKINTSGCQELNEDISDITLKNVETASVPANDILPILEPQSCVTESLCVLDKNVETEDDNTSSALNDRDLKIVEGTKKSDIGSLVTEPYKKEFITTDYGIKEKSDHIEDCCIQEISKELEEERRKFEDETAVIKTKPEYKNSVKCNSYIGSKIAVVSPLQSAENKHLDCVDVDTENRSCLNDCKDQFEDNDAAILKTTKTNTLAFLVQEKCKQNSKVLKSEIIYEAVECKDYLDGTIDTEQVQDSSEYSEKIRCTSTTPGSSDTLITGNHDQLEIQEELSQHDLSSLQYKNHSESKTESDHQNSEACHFNNGETTVLSITENGRKEIILEDLKETSNCNNVENSSESYIEPHFSAVLENVEKKDDTPDTDYKNLTTDNVDGEEHHDTAYCQNFMLNKSDLENKYGSLSKLQDTICSDSMCQSDITHDENVCDIEINTNNKFISTDFTNIESIGVHNKFDTEISNAELHVENKSVFSSENEEFSESIEVEKAKQGDTVIHREVNVISYINNSIKENNGKNETCSIHSNTSKKSLSSSNDSNEPVNFSNESFCTCLGTASDQGKNIKKDENKTEVAYSAAGNSHCVEKSVFGELDANAIGTKEQHKEDEVKKMTEERTNCILMLEDSSVNPQILNVDNSITHIKEPHSKSDSDIQSSSILNKGVLKSKIEMDSDCQLVSDNYKTSKIKMYKTAQELKLPSNEAEPEIRELLNKSRENHETTVTAENLTVSSNNSDINYKSDCKHTLMNLQEENAVNNENISCSNSICLKSDIANFSKEDSSYFVRAYAFDNQNSFACRQSDLKTQDYNNIDCCIPSGDSEINKPTDRKLQFAKHTPRIAEIQCDDQVIDLSCNLVKHSWDDYSDFEKIHHAEIKKIDCDDFEHNKHVNIDSVCCSDRDNNGNISEVGDSESGINIPDSIVSRDNKLCLSLETKQEAIINLVTSINKNSNANIDSDSSESISQKTECEVGNRKNNNTYKNRSTDEQFIDSERVIQETDELKNKTTSSSLCFNRVLKISENKFVNTCLPTDSTCVNDNTDWKYVSCGSQTSYSDSIPEESSFNDGNINGSRTVCRSSSDHPSSINVENLSDQENQSNCSNMNSNLVNLESASEGKIDRPRLFDSSFPEENCNPVEEKDLSFEGSVNICRMDNFNSVTTKTDSESKHSDIPLDCKCDESDHCTNKICEPEDVHNTVDENLFCIRSNNNAVIHQKLLSPCNVQNHLESSPISFNVQNETFTPPKENHVVSPQMKPDTQENDVKLNVQSETRIFDINIGQMDSADIQNDSNVDIINESKNELNTDTENKIVKCTDSESEVGSDTRSVSVVVSDQTYDDSGISTSGCLANLKRENVSVSVVDQNECLDINHISENSNNNSCVEDSLIENIDRVSNSLTLSGNNNFEKLLDPYEFQSSLCSDISIKSEILSNITNIPSKESCPLQCLVEAALALETAVVNKFSQENTDGVQNSEHIVKRKHFYCDNLLNEDSKNVVTSNSTIRTVHKSLDLTPGTNSEVIHLNSQLHQTMNEEVIKYTNETNSDDINVSPNEYYLPKYQSRKGAKKYEKRKTKKKCKRSRISRLKRTRPKPDVTANNSDTLIREDSTEFAHENSKDCDVDRSPCDLDNACHKISHGDIPGEESLLCVSSEYNRINDETVCMTNVRNATECTPRDFIIPDQSVVCFEVTADKMNEYMNQISNLSDVEVITESTDSNNDMPITKSRGNKSCSDGYKKIPGVDLDNETSLVIIIEEIGGSSDSLPDKKENVCIEENVDYIVRKSVDEEEVPTCTDHIHLASKRQENYKIENVKTVFGNSDEQKLNHCCETSESYEHINENLVNDISNWPFLEEEVALDEQNNSSQKPEPKKQPYNLKCSLPWERIFNISNSRKRKTLHNKQDGNVGLELGPAKIEVRLGTESGVWKVVNNSPNDFSSPVVKVKRLILQRDPDLTSSYSEKESEEENDTKEKRKMSVSQSSDDSVPKVVIKKKSTSEYTSFLRLSDDEKWQPVVILTRSKELDELILKEKCIVSSSPCDKNDLDVSDLGGNSCDGKQPLDVYNYVTENDSTEDTKLNAATESKIIPDISNCIFKSTIKKRPLKRRFKFGKSKERKFNKSNVCSSTISVEKRVFTDDEESLGSNKESDYSPTCPVDSSQEFAWQCIEKNGGESPETDSKDFVTSCLISQEEYTIIENESRTDTLDIADSREFSEPTEKNSQESLSEDIIPLMQSAETGSANASCSNDNTITKDDCVSITSCEAVTITNQLIEKSKNDIAEEDKPFDLSASDETKKESQKVNVFEVLCKSVPDDDDVLSQNQNELEDLIAKNGIDQKQSCGTNTENDIQLFGSLNGICIQSTQCNNPSINKSVRDIIVEKPPSENRSRGLKRPSEGHSREDTKRRRYNIKQYPLECHKCHIGFEDKEELVRHKKSRHTPRELHHCLLCQRSFSSSLRYSLHVQGRSHRHIDLVQRYTMHKMHRLITGTDYPLLRPLTKSELQTMDWRPSYPGCNHYYHQSTPLQIALQEHSKGDNKIAVNHT